MSKQFKTKKEFDLYISNLQDKSIDGLLFQSVTAQEVIDNLLKDGYTDLDNLVEDGHAYQIGGYTNHGWLYADEADMDYIKAKGHQVEIRQRN